jgi:hypothetical protein
MDPGFYQDLTGRRYSLPIVLQDCLNLDDAPVIHQFTGARHDAWRWREVAQAAAHRQIGITAREHALADLVGVLVRANQASTSELVRELVAHG